MGRPASRIFCCAVRRSYSHLPERGAARLLDRAQGLPLALLILAQQPAHRGCLHGHHAHRVADDVVQLARDPRALLRDRGACLDLSLALELLGALRRICRGPELAAEREAHEPSDGERERDEGEVADALLGVVVNDEGRRSESDAEASDALLALPDHAEHERGCEHTEEVAERVRGERPVVQGDRDADCEDRSRRAERPAPPGEERDREEKDERGKDPSRPVQLRVAAEPEDHLDRGQRRRADNQ